LCQNTVYSSILRISDIANYIFGFLGEQYSGFRQIANNAQKLWEFVVHNREEFSSKREENSMFL
jgi:hypothetical protein